MTTANVRDSNKKTGRVLIDGALRLVEVLRVHIAELRSGLLRGLSDRSSVCVLVRLDNHDIFQSSSVPKSVSVFGDDFVHEVVGNFSQLHFVVFEPGARQQQRALARISLRKRDVIKYAGKDMWYPIKAMGRQTDVSGQLCLDLNYDETSPAISIRVVDHAGLKIRDSAELYLLVTLHGCDNRGTGQAEVKKLRVGNPEETITVIPSILPQSNGSRCQLQLSLWHDMLGGLNNYFHGEVRIQLNEKTGKPKMPCQGPQWYFLKPRMSVDEVNESGAEGNKAKLGEIRLKICYTAEHILPMQHYQALWTNLVESINQQPFAVTTVGVLELLPAVDLDAVARPLMKIFVDADKIRPLLRIVCTQEISKCQEDVNTMFRSRSLASKVLYELMKFVGHQYLVISLKPVIDKIYREKKCCEIDPCKLKPGECVQTNLTNLIQYAELAFARVVDSNHRCPQALRDVFSDLREVVQRRYPGRVDIQRLALSSFLIMRFFAAAILNPKLFGLKRENADGNVARTLVLISKILQRLSNCVVSAHPLTTKEQWLSPVLQRFTDESHRLAMVKFLDRISLVGGENSISGDSMSLLKDGPLLERPRQRRKRCLKNLLQKRRYVMLTETELLWHKSRATLQPKGRLILSEVNAVEAVDDDGKHVFRVATPSVEVNLQAANALDMQEWMTVLQRQVRKQSLMLTRRNTQPSQLYDVDVERELEAVHMTFYEHAEVLKHWKNALEGTAEIPDDQIPLPDVVLHAGDEEEDDGDENLEQRLDDEEVERPRASTVLYQNIQAILGGAVDIENAHKTAVNSYLSQLRDGKGTRENPIDPDDNYWLVKSRITQKSFE